MAASSLQYYFYLPILVLIIFNTVLYLVTVAKLWSIERQTRFATAGAIELVVQNSPEVQYKPSHLEVGIESLRSIDILITLDQIGLRLNEQGHSWSYLSANAYLCMR